jgi:hypothetical protein
MVSAYAQSGKLFESLRSNRLSSKASSTAENQRGNKNVASKTLQRSRPPLAPLSIAENSRTDPEVSWLNRRPSKSSAFSVNPETNAVEMTVEMPTEEIQMSQLTDDMVSHTSGSYLYSNLATMSKYRSLWNPTAGRGDTVPTPSRFHSATSTTPATRAFQQSLAGSSRPETFKQPSLALQQTPYQHRSVNKGQRRSWMSVTANTAPATVTLMATSKITSQASVASTTTRLGVINKNPAPFFAPRVSNLYPDVGSYSSSKSTLSAGQISAATLETYVKSMEEKAKDFEEKIAKAEAAALSKIAQAQSSAMVEIDKTQSDAVAEIIGEKTASINTMEQGKNTLQSELQQHAAELRQQNASALQDSLQHHEQTLVENVQKKIASWTAGIFPTSLWESVSCMMRSSEPLKQTTLSKPPNQELTAIAVSAKKETNAGKSPVKGESATSNVGSSVSPRAHNHNNMITEKPPIKHIQSSTTEESLFVKPLTKKIYGKSPVQSTRRTSSRNQKDYSEMTIVPGGTTPESTFKPIDSTKKRKRGSRHRGAAISPESVARTGRSNKKQKISVLVSTPVKRVSVARGKKAVTSPNIIEDCFDFRF